MKAGRLRRALRVALLSTTLLLSASIPALQGCGGGDCCKVCKEGKACGDTCIAVTATCNVGGGCACDD